MKDIKWVKIYDCLNRERAYLLKTFLESRGVRVVLQGIEEESIFPGGLTRIPVLVLEEDKEKALKLLDEFFKGSDE